MNSFNEIIKEKVDQFEVPFEEAHWADMESRLDRASSNKTKNVLLGSAAAVVTILVSSYFLFSPSSPEVTQPEISAPAKVVVEEVIEQPSTPAVSPAKILIEEEAAKEESIAVKAVSTKTQETVVVPTIKKSVKQKNTVVATTEAPKPAPVEVSSVEVVKAEEEATKEKQPIVIPTVEEKVTASEAQETTQEVSESEELPIVSAARRKNVRHKAYEDENLTKKSVRRRRMPSFLSFKKRIYKVPLSKKKSKKRKK